MTGDKEATKKLLKTARGQLDGIINMIDDERYCIDISNQLLASISILRKANKEIIRGHLEHCMKAAFTEGSKETIEEKLDEILSVIDKIGK